MDHAKRALLIGGSVLGACVVSGLLPSACALYQMNKKPAKTMDDRPKRPPGEAKPMLDEDIAPVLARLDPWYAANLAPDTYVFNPPATDAQLNAFEQAVGVTLPRAYRHLYKWHDGENDDRNGHIYGLPLLTLNRATDEWRQWQATLKYFDGDRYAIPGGAWPDGAVDSAYINPGWIPLTGDGSGNHIGLDFDPWPGGRVGQVILFGRDEDVKAVLAESLVQFLGWVASLLEGGNVRLETTENGKTLRGFNLKRPATDHFHDGARALLGAPGPFT